MEDYPRSSDPINNSDIDINDSHKYLSNKKYYNSLFPYDVSQNEYQLNQDVSELEKNNSQYVIDTLAKINSQLKSRTSYVPICSTLFHCLLYLLCVIIFLSILYVSVLLCAFCLFNPMLIIAIIFFGLTQGMSLIYFTHCKVKESRQKNKITSIIRIENDEQEKERSKKKWSIGRDGCWIEVKIPLKH